MAQSLKTFSTRVTPQSEPIPGRPEMVANNAGGYTFQIDQWASLRRFLTIGTSGGSYYVSESTLTRENAQIILACLAEDHRRVTQEIATVSDGGLAHKNDYAIFALALAASHGDTADRAYALAALPSVCRTGTHLFQFCGFIEQFRGWGRMLRRGVANWYLSKSPDKLAYQAVKYAQRDGWSHRDVLRLTHPKAHNAAVNALFKWIVDDIDLDDWEGICPDVITGAAALKSAGSAGAAASLIRQYRVPREAVPTHFLTEKVVWEALAEDMPMTALIRNLATMTRVGLLEPHSETTWRLATQIQDPKRIKAARVHPMTVLQALKTYAQGRGERSSATWNPVSQVVDALDCAFYAAFVNVTPVGKPLMLALDISGSMGCSASGMTGMTCRDVAAAMALITVATEPHPVEVTGFHHTLIPLDISARRRLDDVVRYMDSLDFGRTDCALPMLYASQQRRTLDGFQILTDNETWFGPMHPKQALDQYRREVNPAARLAVQAMTASRFSIADPADAGMLDIVGTSSDTPALVAGFFRGEI